MIIKIILKILFIIFSAAISAADIKTGKVPRIAFILAFPVFFALTLLADDQLPLWKPFAGCLTGLIVFLLVYFISGKKLGLADVWYSSLVGLILGPWWWYAAMGSACAAGIIYILILKQRRIPFIPFMALGSVVIGFVKG